jgi:F0F1-type ATP synthase membrane subunit b/b'
MQREHDLGPGGSDKPIFVPLALVVLALLLMTGFQGVQLVRERELLRERITLQEQPIEEAKKLRAQLEAVAKSTAELAKQGNVNAQRIIEQLRGVGVTINLEGATSN